MLGLVGISEEIALCWSKNLKLYTGCPKIKLKKLTQNGKVKIADSNAIIVTVKM